MLNRRVVYAIGLGSLLAIASVTPAIADQTRGSRHNSDTSYQAATPYLKARHRQGYRGHDHRPHWKQHRRAYRNQHRHRGNHAHYRNYRHGSRHGFTNGLLFGGVLGYIIGNQY